MFAIGSAEERVYGTKLKIPKEYKPEQKRKKDIRGVDWGADPLPVG